MSNKSYLISRHLRSMPLSLIMLIFNLLVIILWMWAVMDLIRNNRTDAKSLVLWGVLILLMPIIGSILYFQFENRRSQRKIFLNHGITKGKFGIATILNDQEKVQRKGSLFLVDKRS